MATRFVLEQDPDTRIFTRQDNSLNDWERELRENLGTDGRDSPELQPRQQGEPSSVAGLAIKQPPSAVLNTSNGAQQAAGSFPASCENSTSVPPASSASLESSRVSLMRNPTPLPQIRKERRRSKMQQTLEKAGAKAEAILRKLVESGKLQPGSLGKQCQNSYKRLPAWLQLEAMRQLEWKLGLLDSCLPHAAKIFKDVLRDLRTRPPTQHRHTLHRAKHRDRARTKWESGSYMSLADDDSSYSTCGREAVASEGSAPDLDGKARSAAALAGADARSASTHRDAASLQPSSKLHHSSDETASPSSRNAEQLPGSLLEPHLARGTALDVSQTSSGDIAMLLGQQPRADGSLSGVDPEAHCFLDSTLYQALSGEGQHADGDCDSSSSASGLSSVSGLSAEAQCFSDSGLDEAGPPELLSGDALSACQLDGKDSCSKQRAGGVQIPELSRSSTSSELPSSKAEDQGIACSAGAACSAAARPAAVQAVLPETPAHAASILPEASSARLLDFCRRITGATSRSQFLSETLAAPVHDDSVSCGQSMQLRQDETLSSVQSAKGVIPRGPPMSEQAHALVLRQLPASFLSMMPDQTLPSLLSLSPPSLPAGRSAKRSAQSIQALPGSTLSSLAPPTAQHSVQTGADAMVSSTEAAQDCNARPISLAAVLASQVSQAVVGRSRVSAVKGHSSPSKACAAVMPWLLTQHQEASARPKPGQAQLSKAPHPPQKADKRPSSSSGKTPLQPAAKYTAGLPGNRAPVKYGMPGSSSKLQQEGCCVQALLVGSAALQPDRAACRVTCIPPPASTVDVMALMGLPPQAQTAAEVQSSQAWSRLIGVQAESRVSILCEAPFTAVAKSGPPSHSHHIAGQSADRGDAQLSKQLDGGMELLNLLIEEQGVLGTSTGHPACSPQLATQSAGMPCASSAGSVDTRRSQQPDAGMRLLELLKTRSEILDVPTSCPGAFSAVGYDRTVTPVHRKAVAGNTSGGSSLAQCPAATGAGNVLSQLLSGRCFDKGHPEKQTISGKSDGVSDAAMSPSPAIAIPWASIPQSLQSSRGRSAHIAATTSGASHSTSGPHRKQGRSSAAASSNNDFLAFLAGSWGLRNFPGSACKREDHAKGAVSSIILP